MKKSISLACALLVSLSVNAQEQSTWTASIDWLMVKGDRDYGQLSQRISNVIEETADIHIDDSRSGYHLQLAYRFYEQWTVNAGYLNLGDVDYNVSAISSDIEGLENALESEFPKTGRGFTLGLSYRFPLTHYLYLDANMQGFNWKMDNQKTINGVSFNQEADGTDIGYGLSLGSNYLDKVDVAVGWNTIKLDNESLQLLSLGVSMSF